MAQRELHLISDGTAQTLGEFSTLDLVAGMVATDTSVWAAGATMSGKPALVAYSASGPTVLDLPPNVLTIDAVTRTDDGVALLAVTGLKNNGRVILEASQSGKESAHLNGRTVRVPGGSDGISTLIRTSGGWLVGGIRSGRTDLESYANGHWSETSFGPNTGVPVLAAEEDITVVGFNTLVGGAPNSGNLSVHGPGGWSRIQAPPETLEIDSVAVCAGAIYVLAATQAGETRVFRRSTTNGWASLTDAAAYLSVADETLWVSSDHVSAIHCN